MRHPIRAPWPAYNLAMRNLFSLTCLSLALLTGAPAIASDLVLVHARVYPSPEAAPLDDATIVVHDDRIVAVTSGNGTKQAPKGALVLDCTGMSVTAGLWNSHVHILPVALLHADQKTGAQLTSALQNMLTHWGFTTVFDISSILANTNTIRSRIALGEVLGPHILTTGEPFFPLHGVPVYVQGYLEQNHIALPDDATTADAVARVAREIHDGADGVKIFAGSIQADSVLMFDLDRAQAIVKEAHRLQRPVFAHPTNLAGVEIALKSGVDVLAHVTSDNEGWTPALMARMRAAHMALIPTLTLFDVEATKGGASHEEARKIAQSAAGRLRLYNEAGGEILFGTDVGYIYQFDTAEEYTLMQQAGMTFPQILAALTTNPARRFGFAAHSGRIAEKMDADLVVVMSDPAADVTAFSRVRYTIRAGKVIYQSAPPVSASHLGNY
jgi:imidazolonepropionase-like amidohydrolase